MTKIYTRFFVPKGNDEHLCGVFGQRPIHFEHAHLCAIRNIVRSNQRHDSGDEVKFKKL